MANVKDGASLHCSFCGKSQREVKKLIAGPNVYICDECIQLCNDIIAEEAVKVINDEIKKKGAVATSLSKILGLSQAEILGRLQRDKLFVWIARKISPAKAEAIKRLMSAFLFTAGKRICDKRSVEKWIQLAIDRVMQ